MLRVVSKKDICFVMNQFSGAIGPSITFIPGENAGKPLIKRFSTYIHGPFQVNNGRVYQTVGTQYKLEAQLHESREKNGTQFRVNATSLLNCQQNPNIFQCGVKQDL